MVLQAPTLVVDVLLVEGEGRARLADVIADLAAVSRRKNEIKEIASVYFFKLYTFAVKACDVIQSHVYVVILAYCISSVTS